MIERNMIVDSSVDYPNEVVAALQRFKSLGTSNNDPEARLTGMQVLINELLAAYDIDLAIQLYTGSERESDEHIIFVNMNTANLSIITLLHTFARIKKLAEDGKLHSSSEDRNPENINMFEIYGYIRELFISSQRFAINLFRKVYPEQFAKLEYNPQTGFFSRSRVARPAVFGNTPFVHLMGTQPPNEITGRRRRSDDDEPTQH